MVKKRKDLPKKLKQQVQEASRSRCVYCQAARENVYADMEFDHIFPHSKQGSDTAENLCYSCPKCNRRKGNKTTGIDPETKASAPLFNPHTQNWEEHFEWVEGGVFLKGLTPTGRATIEVLSINSDTHAVAVRRKWVSVGWHPPQKEK